MATKNDPEEHVAVGSNLPAAPEYFDPAELTFANLQKMAAAGDIDVLDSSALDDQDGFLFMSPDRKADLVGSPFFIVKAAEGQSKRFDSNFVTVWIVTERGNRLKFVDFGAGVKQQVLPLIDNETHESRPGIAVFCQNGLSESKYDADPETGRPGGVTYYLDTSGGLLPAGRL